MTRICCVCNRVERQGSWVSHIAFAADEQVTHGYCPPCFTKAMAAIEDFILEKPGAGASANFPSAGRSVGVCD